MNRATNKKRKDFDGDDDDLFLIYPTRPKEKCRRKAREIIASRQNRADMMRSGCDVSIARVALSQEYLLSLSLEEFDKQIDKIVDTKSLSGTEAGEVRRQRRLIINRECAQVSRDRRKKQQKMVDEMFIDLQISHASLADALEESEARRREIENKCCSLEARVSVALNAAKSIGESANSVVFALENDTTDYIFQE